MLPEWWLIHRQKYFQSIGERILVFAMLVSRSWVAHLWTDCFDRKLFIAGASAVVATVTGIFVSYHLNTFPGGCILLAQDALFLPRCNSLRKNGILNRKRI